jgi:hypothetical protein
VLALTVTTSVASADAVYHAQHIPLTPVGDEPLRNGFVQNIHANGPIVYAHEQYVVNGAAADASLQVTLLIWTANTECSGDPALVVPTAVVATNAVGNGTADAVFTPTDAGDLRGHTVSIRWELSEEGTVMYATDCEIVTLD